MSRSGIEDAAAQLSGHEGTVEESPLLTSAGVAGTLRNSAELLVSRGDNSPAVRSLDSGITRACLTSALIMSISPLQYGYHIAELNTPKRIITSCDSDSPHWPPLPLCLPMNDNMFSIATSVFAIGGLAGSLSAGWMAERWGRRGALVYNNLTYVLGPILMAFAVSPGMLIAGRFISGVGSGAAIVIAPLYLSEIAPIRYRGTLNLLNQLSIVVGILVTLTIGMVANKGPYWRISVGFGLALACLHISVAAFAVESPRYLWSRGKRAEARQVLRKLRCTSNVDEEVAGWTSSRSPNAGDDDENDGEEGLHGAQRRDKRAVTIFNIFAFPEYRKPWMLVILLQFGQQLSGINTVFYYSSSVLEKMFSSHVSSVLTMMIGVLNVVATASAAAVVDRFGRRPLLFTSMAAMTVSVTLLGVGLGLNLNVLAAVSLYLVVASFAPGYGPVPFLLGTEFFDVRAASAGGSWALAANWIGTFIVAVAFLPMQNLIGEWVFAVFVSALLVCGSVFYFKVPETKGRTIEEIAKGFR
ncbi:general substrate transporter [Martensiomyces pterosporus]|nr:general substrate transporter [Martensiomyces pterosporus]